MSSLRQILALIVFLVITFSAAGVGSLATTSNIPNWYAGLAKPSWTPPSWIFGPVWTLLYISMATAAWLVWRVAVHAPGSNEGAGWPARWAATASVTKANTFRSC